MPTAAGQMTCSVASGRRIGHRPHVSSGASPTGFPTPVFFLKKKKTFIAYTPALDVSESGTSPANGKKNFETTLCLFLEELLEHSPLEEVLKE
jgi:hypothetical protein